jgi:hypothetical protein
LVFVKTHSVHYWLWFLQISMFQSLVLKQWWCLDIQNSGQDHYVTLQEGAAIQDLGSQNQISKSMGCGQAGLIALIHQSVVETLCSAKYLLPLYYDHIHILLSSFAVGLWFWYSRFLWVSVDFGSICFRPRFGLFSHSTTRECGFSHTNSCSSWHMCKVTLVVSFITMYKMWCLLWHRLH